MTGGNAGGPATGPVVVGVSPTTGSPSALRWAADYARLHDAPLVAVMAFRAVRPPAAPGGRPPSSLMTGDTPDPGAEAGRRLEEFVTAALGASAKVDCRAVKGSAVSSLLAVADGAQLLVLGEPRPGRIASVRASLVAPQIVLRAGCPVVALPSPAA